MAIDSEDKRRSVQGYTNMFTVYPVADNTVGTQDRVHAAFLYRGITINTPTVVESVGLRQGWFRFKNFLGRRVAER